MSANTYLLAGNGADGSQLWLLSVDGDELSAAEFANLYPETKQPNGTGALGLVANDANPTDFTNFAGGTMFVASGLHTGRELFVSDGTAAGSHLVLDLYPGYSKSTPRYHGTRYTRYDNIKSSEPRELTSLGARVVMLAADASHLSELFSSNGTSQGTYAIESDGLYAASYLTALGDKAIFSGVSNVATAGGAAGAHGLWVTDGTVAGTHAVAGPEKPGLPYPDGTNAAGSGFATVQTRSGGIEAFFAGTTTATGTELWVTDGTDQGTKLVADIWPGKEASVSDVMASSSPSFITAFGTERVLFTAASARGYAEDATRYGRQLFVYDGLSGETGPLTSFNPNDGALYGLTGIATGVVGDGEKAFFVARVGGTLDPWVSDGTAAGTRQLLSYGNAYAGDFTAFDGKMFFRANDGSHGTELWVSDGKPLGTSMFDDINVGAGDSAPHGFQVLGDRLLFMADDGSGDKLWETDGTLAGTHLAAGAGVAAVDIASVAPACFLAGTLILTLRGEIPVQDLVVGDLVLTLSGQGNPLQPILWIGRSAFDARRHPRPDQVTPIRFAAGSLGDGLPHSDLLVSPGHAMLIDGVLMQAERLVNGATITRDSGIARGEYFHVEVAQHDILLSAGVPSESFLDTGNRGHFNNAADIVDLHPDFSPKHWTETCRPLVQDGPVLAAAKARLLQRAHAAGFVARADHGLHVVADGRIVEGEPCGEKAYCFTIPAGCAEIVLASRVWVPSELQPASTDMRRLGVFVQRMVADGRVVALDDAALSGGWHALERDGAATRRWTSGRAALPAGMTNLVIELFSRPHYWQHDSPLAALSRASIS